MLKCALKVLVLKGDAYETENLLSIELEKT